MRKAIAVLFILLMGSGVAFSQYSAEPLRPRVEVIQLNDSTASGLQYSNDANDTSISYNVDEWTSAGVRILALDSVEVYLNYLGSTDGVNFEAEAAADSLITTTASDGDVLMLPAKAMHFKKVKLVLAFEAAGNGVTTPTYTAWLVRKR